MFVSQFNMEKHSYISHDLVIKMYFVVNDVVISIFTTAGRTETYTFDIAHIR